MTILNRVSVALGVALLATSTAANATELITNGGFETGDYTGWSVNVQDSSLGNLSVVPNSGGLSPLSSFPFQPNPGGGNFFSITDQTGPGSYSLTQSFTLSAAAVVKVSFQTFANNEGGGTVANGRDFNTQDNQNAVVDLVIGGADPFSEAPGDVVAVFYGPGSDDPSGDPHPFATYATSLSLAAGTYVIRFAETDNLGNFQQGVDNVSITTSVPEPMTWTMLLAGFGGIGVVARRSRRVASA